MKGPWAIADSMLPGWPWAPWWVRPPAQADDEPDAAYRDYIRTHAAERDLRVTEPLPPVPETVGRKTGQRLAYLRGLAADPTADTATVEAYLSAVAGGGVLTAYERLRAEHGQAAHVCEACGVTFTPRRSGTRACSDRCRQRLHRRSAA